MALTNEIISLMYKPEFQEFLRENGWVNKNEISNSWSEETGSQETKRGAQETRPQEAQEKEVIEPKIPLFEAFPDEWFDTRGYVSAILEDGSLYKFKWTYQAAGIVINALRECKITKFSPLTDLAHLAILLFALAYDYMNKAHKETSFDKFVEIMPASLDKLKELRTLAVEAFNEAELGSKFTVLRT